jgi:hypothetical protein
MSKLTKTDKTLIMAFVAGIQVGALLVIVIMEFLK